MTDFIRFLASIPWIVVGGAVGAFVAVYGYAKLTGAQSNSEALWRLAASFRSLGRALVPLLLPVCMLAAVATTGNRWAVQVVAGALLAALIWFLIRGEGEIKRERERVKILFAGTRDALRTMKTARAEAEPPLRTLAHEAPPRGVAAVSLVAVLFLSVPALTSLYGDGWSEWKAATGWSGGLIWAGVQLLLFAAVLRLAGYATTLVRGFVVAAVVLICARVSVLIGLVPGENDIESALSYGLTLAGLGVALGALLAYESIKLRGKTSASPSVWNVVFRTAGFIAAVLSATALAAGAVFARSETTGGAKAVPGAEAREQPVRLANVPGGVQRQLAWTFAPILRLHPDEPFPPTSAADYVLRARAGASNDCGPSNPRACTKLSCPDCSDSANSTNESLHRQGVVFYARVATTETDPDVLEGWTPGATKLATLVQYWIFYDYNRWAAKTAVGNLVQEHDADWEFVAVGLDAEHQPLFVALSAHCGGQVARWEPGLAVLPDRVDGDRVRIVTPTAEGELPATAPERATHPIVAVALGSHGNYADNSGRRPPDWGSCKKVPSGALAPLTYASNVRDITSGSTDGRRLVQADDIEVVTQSSYPLNIRAPWGEERLSFGWRSFGPTNGPRSPPVQKTWSSPIKLFFCDKYWRAYEEAPKDKC